MASHLFFTLFIFTTPMFLQPILSQDPASPTAEPCSSRLLTLVPCGPFVQGLVPSPAQPCCDGLSQLYDLQPSCLCLFLNNSSALPINRTLALELPQLCSLPVDSSACSATLSPTNSTGSQIALDANKNATVAASPEVQVAPRPISLHRFGFGQSSANPETEIQQTILATAALALGMFLFSI